MPRTLLRDALLAWVVLLVLAILNGIVRDAVYGPRIGELVAHQLSTVVLSALVLGVAAAFVRQVGSLSAGQAWGVGAGWVGLTLAFELGFFHYVVGHPWAALLADYNLARGRVFPLVLLASLVGPPLMRAWLRRRGA